VVVTDQGGEPHTFTDVKKFGGGFIDALNMLPGSQRAHTILSAAFIRGCG